MYQSERNFVAFVVFYRLEYDLIRMWNIMLRFITYRFVLMPLSFVFDVVRREILMDLPEQRGQRGANGGGYIHYPVDATRGPCVSSGVQSLGDVR